MNILRRRVLILNKDWTVIGTCTVRRAMILISSFDEDNIPKARGVCDDLSVYEWNDWIDLDPGQFYVRSVYKNIKAPEVIISRTKTLPKVHANFSREGVFKRDEYRCQYCNKYVNSGNLTIDHVIPRCRGGKHDWYNCVASCIKCNNHKGDKLLEETTMKLLKIPEKPKNPLIICDNPMPKLWKKFIH